MDGLSSPVQNRSISDTASTEIAGDAAGTSGGFGSF
jgi:hypothetical protein